MIKQRHQVCLYQKKKKGVSYPNHNWELQKNRTDRQEVVSHIDPGLLGNTALGVGLIIHLIPGIEIRFSSH